MQTQAFVARRPSRLGLLLGWLILVVCVALIAGTLAQLARLPAALFHAGVATREATAMRQWRRF